MHALRSQPHFKKNPATNRRRKSMLKDFVLRFFLRQGPGYAFSKCL